MWMRYFVPVFAAIWLMSGCQSAPEMPVVPVVVELSEPGVLMINGRDVLVQDLKRGLKESGAKTETRLVLVADPDAPYGRVARIHQLCRSLGYENLVLTSVKH